MRYPNDDELTKLGKRAKKHKEYMYELMAKYFDEVLERNDLQEMIEIDETLNEPEFFYSYKAGSKIEPDMVFQDHMFPGLQLELRRRIRAQKTMDSQ